MIQKIKNPKVSKVQNPSIAAGFQPAAPCLDHENQNKRHEGVAKLAHQLWEHRGSPQGDSLADWFEAEAQTMKSGS